MGDESIDLVFCDPPYLQKDIEDGIYSWLAQEAARVLKPGGFCLAYVGTLYLPQALEQMQRSLTYHWEFIILSTGFGPILWKYHVIAQHKSILAFVKGQGRPTMKTLSVWTGGGKDKRFHQWGQDESTARYYMECFSRPGDLIWDPFTGGGTIPAIALQSGRRFIAFECDPVIAARAQKRLQIIQPRLLSTSMIHQLDFPLEGSSL